MMSIKELMEFYDYRPSGSCGCDGFLTVKYKRGAFTFRWRKNKYTFKITEDKVDIIPWTPVSEAWKILKQLHHVEPVSA